MGITKYHTAEFSSICLITLALNYIDELPYVSSDGFHWKKGPTHYRSYAKSAAGVLHHVSVRKGGLQSDAGG